MKHGNGSHHGDDSDSADKEIHAGFDWEDIKPSVAVIKVISISANEKPTEIDVLNDVIDPNALDKLITSGTSDGSENNVSVTFTYYNYQISVRSTGDILAKSVE